MEPESAHPLRLSISELHRGPIRREFTLADPAEAVDDPPPDLEGPLEIDVEVTAGRERDVRARGSISARMRQPCRRCLTEVSKTVPGQLDVWFRPDTDAVSAEESVWPLDQRGGEIDLAPAVREELWLITPEYMLCRPDCPGLCPSCGARRDTESCECTDDEQDPRWARLEALRVDMEGASET